MNSVRLLLALFVMTSGAAMAASQPEPLYSVVWGAQGITLQVESHGCTRPGDFVWQLQPVAAGESAELSKLQLQRKQADRCRRKPYLQSLFFAWSQLPGPAATAIQAGKPFALSNPLLLSARIQP
ncbi:MAG: hypothetical protein QMB40_08660 [Aeromonadaceae bacterium]